MLSGGQKQRISIMWSLLTDAKIIVVDEPTSAIDAENSKKIIQKFKVLAMDKRK